MILIILNNRLLKQGGEYWKVLSGVTTKYLYSAYCGFSRLLALVSSALSGMIIMKKAYLIKFDWIILISICLFTFAMAIYAAQPWKNNYAYQKLSDYFPLIGMMIWAISPYLAMCMALLVFTRKNILIKTFSVCMIVISLFSGFLIFDTILINIDAQGGLVFISLPLYQWLAFFILLFICAIVNKFA